MKKYNGILIDLDNTIYPYKKSHDSGMEALYNSLKNDGLVNSFDEFLKNFESSKLEIKRITQGQAASHNRLLYIQSYLETFHTWNSGHSLRLYETYWSTFLDEMTPFEDAIFFLQKAQLPTIIVTDLTAHIQHRKIEKLGLNGLINGLVTSEESGCEKPTAGIFERALGKLLLNKNEILFIGDDYKKDILGAIDFGVDVAWLRRDANYESSFVSGNIIEFSNFRSLLGFV